MILSARILGGTIAKQLQERAAAPVLRIGSDTFTRGDLAAVACFNFTAAANLSTILGSLGVKHTKDVFTNVPPSSLALPHLGAVSLAVLGAAFEARGLGGDAPLEAWVRRHQQAGTNDPMVTFATLKHRDAEATATERRTRRNRKLARRGQAHRLRVARFSKTG